MEHEGSWAVTVRIGDLAVQRVRARAGVMQWSEAL